MKPSYMLTASQLNATVDATGVVNLTKLHDMCVERLHIIDSNRAGSGRRTKRSVGCLSRRVHAFLSEHNFAHAGAPVLRWFWESPHAEFSLQVNAES